MVAFVEVHCLPKGHIPQHWASIPRPGLYGLVHYGWPQPALLEPSTLAVVVRCHFSHLVADGS